MVSAILSRALSGEVRTGNDGPLRTISQVAETLSLPQHVLRFWETRFAQIRPVKSRGGRRYYRPQDVDTLHLIRELLYDHGYTIRGAQRFFKEQQLSFPVSVNLPDVPEPPLPRLKTVDELTHEEKQAIEQILLELSALKHLLVRPSRGRLESA